MKCRLCLGKGIKTRISATGIEIKGERCRKCGGTGKVKDNYQKI